MQALLIIISVVCFIIFLAGSMAKATQIHAEEQNKKMDEIIKEFNRRNEEVFKEMARRAKESAPKEIVNADFEVLPDERKN